jgi:hypothetical protein
MKGLTIAWMSGTVRRSSGHGRADTDQWKQLEVIVESWNEN